MTPPPDEQPTNDKERRVRFHYIKSNHFRVVYATGAYGGLGPSGTNIHVSFYNDRHPVPQQLMHVLNKDGTLGAEVPEGRVSKDGIVREVEADVVMDLPAAIALRDWLSRKLKEVGVETEEASE